MRRVNTWQCDHCSKQGDIEVLEVHEKKCMMNPKHKACSTCKNEETEWWNGSPSYSCKILFEYSDHDIKGQCPKHELKQ